MAARAGDWLMMRGIVAQIVRLDKTRPGGPDMKCAIALMSSSFGE
jgi:hypothetical protein